jgi:sucrose phosphorylase
MPVFPQNIEHRIRDHLTFLYGQENGALYFTKLRQILRRFRELNLDLLRTGVAPGERLTEADAVLITYGDQILEPGRPPLQALGAFLEAHLRGVISSVHILPFFPYSSDDGFSVIDYTRVNPDLGSWDDVEEIGHSFRLMFDLVINHVSAHSDWFGAFLAGDPEFTDFFHVVEPGTHLSMVTRPRALPLLTPVHTPFGEKLVWTTFSADQIDLNFANPEVLLEFVKILLFYVEKGAEIIRLDAIAFLWKEIGTSCIHLPQTHRVVQLFRAVLDAVAPNVLLITETNVPHEENVSYFGDGSNEAQMVYQFPLAPLILNAFYAGDATHLQQWADGIQAISETTTFFNFTASHDGVGLRPAEGILNVDEINELVTRTQKHGGFVSYKTDLDGTQSPYELNISYFDALSNPADVEREGIDVQVRRFMASQAIMLSLAGVPGVYVHSILGSRSYREGVQRTGRNRTINREKLLRLELENSLTDASSLRYRIFQAYTYLLRVRTAQRAFHPNGGQKVLLGNRALFVVLRTSMDGQEKILCLHNVSPEVQNLQITPEQFGVQRRGMITDLVTGTRYLVTGDGRLSLNVEPYQVLWLKA